jgi:hypothetical protein
VLHDDAPPVISPASLCEGTAPLLDRFSSDLVAIGKEETTSTPNGETVAEYAAKYRCLSNSERILLVPFVDAVLSGRFAPPSPALPDMPAPAEKLFLARRSYLLSHRDAHAQVVRAATTICSAYEAWAAGQGGELVPNRMEERSRALRTSLIIWMLLGG